MTSLDSLRSKILASMDRAPAAAPCTLADIADVLEREGGTIEDRNPEAPYLQVLYEDIEMPFFFSLADGEQGQLISVSQSILLHKPWFAGFWARDFGIVARLAALANKQFAYCKNVLCGEFETDRSNVRALYDSVSIGLDSVSACSGERMFMAGIRGSLSYRGRESLDELSTLLSIMRGAYFVFARVYEGAGVDIGLGFRPAAGSGVPAGRCTKADIASIFTNDPAAAAGDPDVMEITLGNGVEETSLRIFWPADDAGQFVVVESDGFAALSECSAHEAQPLANRLNGTVRGYVDFCLRDDETTEREKPLLESLGVYVAEDKGMEGSEVRVRGSVPYEGEESLEDVKSLVALIASLQVSLRDR